MIDGDAPAVTEEEYHDNFEDDITRPENTNGNGNLPRVEPSRLGVSGDSTRWQE